MDKKEKDRIRNKKYYIKNRDKILSKHNENKERNSLNSKKHYIKNKKRKLELARTRYKLLRDKDPVGVSKKEYDFNLKRYYGISYEDYDKLLLSQNNACAICKNPEYRRRLSVDHCHATGKIRGLLCTKCNVGIGSLNDNIEYLKNAIDYLNK